MNVPPGTVVFDENFGTQVLNATEVPSAEVYEAMRTQDDSLLRTLGGWVESTRLHASAAVGAYGSSTGNRNGGLLMRDRFVAPTGVYDQMRLSYDALNDDVVSGVAETTESLAFSAVDFFALDPDEEDVYNQIGAQIDLDARLREIWRELFAVSQCYIAVWWSRQTFKVRGKSKEGVARKKTFTVMAPQELMLLDPLKIVPVGSGAFGREKLAYIAEPYESDSFSSIIVDPSDPRFMDRTRDPVVERLVTGRYTPTRVERLRLGEMGVNPDHLWLLDDRNVFRHTLTRAAFQPFPQIRMRTVFELLDMKQQLRQMERAHLIGGTNFIVVITKGTDQHPAQPAEIANLHVQARTVGRVPVMVGDHRLHVEIVTPKLDNTLKAERWNTVDSRITSRLYGMFMLGNYAAGAANDDSIKLAKVISRGMESRRHMIRRSLEANIFKRLYEQNDEFTGRPKLQFHPRSIALDFDSAYASFLMDLRAANDLSRETMLNQFDLDQQLEAELRKREKEEYDDVFQTQVPFSTPNPALNAPPPAAVPPDQVPKQAPADPKSTRRDNGGGRRNGGGAAPGTGQGEAPRRVNRQNRQNASAYEGEADEQPTD